MSTTRCERARELLPDFGAGRLAGADLALVEAHLPRCPECTAEADLVRMLHVTRPRPAEGSAMRVRAAVLADRRPARQPVWALLAASVGALAIGIGVVSERAREVDVPAFVDPSEAAPLWMADDAMVAGGLVLDDLSEEDLRGLLEELSTGGPA